MYNKPISLIPMMRVLRVLFALSTVACGISAPAQDELTKLADGVFVNVVSPDSNAVSNSGVVILDHGVLVFDTHFTPEAGHALLARIQALTPKPVRYVVNSHFHSDHTHGNQAFPNAPFIFASYNGRRDILQKDVPALGRTVAAVQSQIDKMRKDAAAQRDSAARDALLREAAGRREALDRLLRLRIIPPAVTFDETLAVQDGSQEVRLLYLGIGHTEGDIILFLPAEKVVFAGDLFFNSAFPSTQDANLLSWMKALRELLKLDAEKFIPGHGSPGTKKDVSQFMGYLEDLRALVEPAVARGDSVEQLIRDTPVPSKYSGFRFTNFFAANLQKMYVELKALRLAETAEPESGKKPEGEKPLP